ncbi:B3 domain-containing protein At1g49475 [Linum perenne]
MSFGLRPTPGFGAHVGGAPVLFCELIVSHDVESRMLRLPKEYTRILPRQPATLTVPSRDDWEMQLLRDKDGFVWLGAGWENFYAFYRMGFGHLLMFQYTGTSHFFVVIFDRTATEITYPLHHPPSPQAPEDSDSVQILDSPPAEPAHVEDEDYTSSVEILQDRPAEPQSLAPLTPQPKWRRSSIDRRSRLLPLAQLAQTPARALFSHTTVHEDGTTATVPPTGEPPISAPKPSVALADNNLFGKDLGKRMKKGRRRPELEGKRMKKGRRRPNL